MVESRRFSRPTWWLSAWRKQGLRLAPQVAKFSLALAVGVGAGGGLWAATSMHRLIPDQLPRIYVASGCGVSKATVEFLTGASEIVLVPTYQGQVDADACAHTHRLLVERGYFWLDWFNRDWLCGRFAVEGQAFHATLNDDGTVPITLRGEEVTVGMNDKLLAELTGAPLEYFAELGSERPE